MDKNSTIGLVLIGAILLIYFQFFSPKPQLETQEIAPKKEITKPVVQSSTSNSTDSSVAQYPEKNIVLENNKIKVVLSSVGAKVKSVELKDFKDQKRNQLVLVDENSLQEKYEISVSNGLQNLNALSYSTSSPDNVFVKDSSKVVFETLINGQKVSQIYELATDSYLLKKKLDLSAVQLKNNNINYVVTDFVRRTELDPKVSKTHTTINAHTPDGIESISETKLEKEEADYENVDWFTMKTKFFLVGIIPQNAVSKLKTSTVADETDTTTIKVLSASTALPINGGKTQVTYYFGPNKYDVCNSVSELGVKGFEDNVYLGWPVFRSINKLIILPAFNFLEGIFSNYGLIILLLVVLVKAVLFPLSYKSYVSMAKIKVLKPELDEIKSRVGDDMAAQQQEQMKLYQSVGVNPLSGCIPVLLQMPILLAMFNFFPNIIELRHKSFLWADDLSIYDTFMKLPFSVPFGYGDHVSMFTILMTISTLVYTWYNSQMQSSAMSGPMQYMQYVMPIIFLFVLNSMSSGLTYYYFVSNVITIVQQFIIRTQVDEAKVREKLDEYKLKVKDGVIKKSRFQQRMEDTIKASEEAKKNRKK
ncbi:MAG: membrane protein insertase YidC [Cytophagales bacterium]